MDGMREQLYHKTAIRIDLRIIPAQRRRQVHGIYGKYREGIEYDRVTEAATSIHFNTVVFILLIIFYECLRRMIPSVYSSRKRMHHMQAATASINQKDHRSTDETKG